MAAAPKVPARARRAFTRLSCALPMLLVATGCAAAPRAADAKTPSPGAHAHADTVALAQPMAPPAPAPPPAQASSKAAAAPGKPADAKSAKNAGPSHRAAVVIFEGDMKMNADEEAIPKTIDAIIDIAEAAGGNLAARKDASVTIKVPSATFRETMTKIDALGGVTSRSVKADDVSEEFHDLEVRLANLKATRARLQEFLAKAGDIPNMLTVERELERVAQEVDRIEGRLEFLRTRAAMSQISVALTAKPKVAPVVASGPARSSPEHVDLPIPWVEKVGLEKLLTLKDKK